MTDTPSDRVPVLKDEAGAYYLLTPEILALARVPDDGQADLERALSARMTRQDTRQDTCRPSTSAGL